MIGEFKQCAPCITNPESNVLGMYGISVPTSDPAIPPPTDPASAAAPTLTGGGVSLFGGTVGASVVVVGGIPLNMRYFIAARGKPTQCALITSHRHGMLVSFEQVVASVSTVPRKFP